MQLKSFLVSLAILTSTSAGPLLDKRQTYSDYFLPITELIYCANPLNVPACWAAHGHAEIASAAAQLHFQNNPTSLHNGRGDAFRHCYWNARMTIDPGIGVDKAEEIANNHEVASNGPQAEKIMDYENNWTGRRIGLEVPGETIEEKYATAERVCLESALEDILVILN